MVVGTYWRSRRQLWCVSAFAHDWWSYDESNCHGDFLVIPTEAIEGSCGVGVLWQTACGAIAHLSFKEDNRSYLLGLLSAAVNWESIGTQPVELSNV